MQGEEFQEDTISVSERMAAEALIVDVGAFEGPLDLLLTLSRTQKVDLRQISILALAEQYLAFVEKAKQLRLELAADYLVMAAWLAFLKSRLLLPPDPSPPFLFYYGFDCSPEVWCCSTPTFLWWRPCEYLCFWIWFNTVELVGCWFWACWEALGIEVRSDIFGVLLELPRLLLARDGLRG